VGVEVAKVVGGDGAEIVEHAPRQLDLVGDRIAVLGEHIGQYVAPVEQNRTHPGEVIETDLVDEDAVRLDAQQARHEALEADGDVAETNRPMTRVEQRTRDDPDGVREVDDPRIRACELAHPLGDSEHDGNSAHRLREAAGARRLLTDAPACERYGLVAEARLLAADPNLYEYKVCAVDGAVEIVGDLEPASVALALEHPPRHRADNLPALGIDVLENEVGDLEACKPRHQLGGIGRSSADDCDLHLLVIVLAGLRGSLAGVERCIPLKTRGRKRLITAVRRRPARLARANRCRGPARRSRATCTRRGRPSRRLPRA
jgi:hypothetical protein